MFPHRIMGYVFNEVGLDFTQKQLHAYWDSAIEAGEGWASEDVQSFVPLGLYGDAAQLAVKIRKEKLLCLWLNVPCFRPRSIRYSRFLLWSIDTRRILPQHTLNSVWRWIVWSCNALYTGRHPTVGPTGQPLKVAAQQRAGTLITHQGHRFQCTELRGDWEFHKLVWELPKCSWVSTCVCFKCPARAKSDDAGLLYWNADPSSKWSLEEFTTAQFIS